MQNKLQEYRSKNLHLQKADIIERSKVLLFNDLLVSTNNDWEWSVFDSNYSNNEEFPIESTFFNYLFFIDFIN